MKKTLLSLVFSVLTAHIIAQPALFYRSHQINNPINDFQQTVTGDSVWLATDLGVELLTDFGSNSTLILPNFVAYCITLSGSSVWVGGQDSIAHFDGNNWTFYSGFNLPTPSIVIDIKVINNVVWLIANNQLFRMLGNGFINMNRQASSITPAPVGNRFALRSPQLTGYTCIEYVNGSWDSLPATNQIQGARTLSSITYIGQSLWAVSHTNKVVRFNRLIREWEDLGIEDMQNIIANRNKIYTFRAREFYEIDPLTKVVTDSFSFRYYSLSGSSTHRIKSMGSRVMYSPNDGLPTEIYINAALRKEKSLDLNNFSWPINPSGAIGHDRFSFKEVRIDNKKSIFTMTPWMSGLYNQATFVNAPTYGLSYLPYASGPISDIYDGNYIEKYDRVWKVNRDEIELHKQNHSNSNYTMPEDIATWPGNGDHTKGEAFHLAPFVDVNGNGIYEPELGDYPDILGHQAVYTIFSNQRQDYFFGASREGPRGQVLEFHLMMYAFDSAEVSSLNNSVFLNYRVFNRSEEDVEDATFTLFTDWGMSNPVTSVCGSDSTENLFFGYNISSFDVEYGSSPVAVAGSLLNQPLDGHMYFMRPDFQFFTMTDPRISFDVIRYVNYQWLNGNPLVRQSPNGPNSNNNGLGFSPPNIDSTFTNWAFNTPDNWYFPPSEMHDTRSLANTKLGTIKPGEHRCVEFAFTHGYDSTDNSGDWQNALTRARNHMNAAKSVYDNLNTGCLGAVLTNETFEDSRLHFKTYPNPLTAGQTMYIETNDRVNGIEMIATSGQQLQVGYKSTSSGYEIDIPKEIASGIYLLRIHTAHKGLVIEKVLVQ